MEDKDRQCRIRCCDALRLFIDNPYKSSDEQQDAAGHRIAVWFYHALVVFLRRLGGSDPQLGRGLIQPVEFYEEVQQEVRNEYPGMCDMPEYSGYKIRRIFRCFIEARLAFGIHTGSTLAEIADQKERHDFVFAICEWIWKDSHTCKSLGHIIENLKTNFIEKFVQTKDSKSHGMEHKISMFTTPPPMESPCTCTFTTHSTLPTVKGSHNTHRSSCMTSLPRGEEKLRETYRVEHEAQDLAFELEKQKVQHAAEIGRLQKQHASELAEHARSFNETIKQLTSSFEGWNLQYEAEIKDLKETHETRISEYEEKIDGLEKASQAQQSKLNDEMKKSSASSDALVIKHQQAFNSLCLAHEAERLAHQELVSDLEHSLEVQQRNNDARLADAKKHTASREAVLDEVILRLKELRHSEE